MRGRDGTVLASSPAAELKVACVVRLLVFFFYMFSVALASFELGRCSCCLGARLFVYTHPQIEPLGMQSTMQVRGFCGKSHKSIPGFNMLATGNGTAG